MPNLKKKKSSKMPLPVSESAESSDDDFVGEMINVDFEAFPANDGDFHGITRLLQQMFRDLETDVAGMANAIIAQNFVGSVFKQCNDDADELLTEDEEAEVEEIYGVTTAINLTTKKDFSCISGLTSAILQKCSSRPADAGCKILCDVLSSGTMVGLLISERVVNLPSQLAIAGFESLWQEIQDAISKKMPYDFTYILMICKLFRLKTKHEGSDDVIWSNPEEELLSHESVASFEYEIKGDTAISGKWEEDDDEYLPFRRIILLKASDLPTLIARLKNEMGQNA